MKAAHAHLCDVLSRFWEERAIELSAFETVSLIEWTYSYYKSLKRFGINDD
jgi:hypothetical protein